MSNLLYRCTGLSQLFKASMTSVFSGNRPAIFLENTSCPSTFTSKIPPLPGINSASIPSDAFNAAAKLAALGR